MHWLEESTYSRTILPHPVYSNLKNLIIADKRTAVTGSTSAKSKFDLNALLHNFMENFFLLACYIIASQSEFDQILR